MIRTLLRRMAALLSHRPVPVRGRNDPCHCGSGRKYKKCCLTKDAERARSARETGVAAEDGSFGGGGGKRRPRADEFRPPGSGSAGGRPRGR